MRPSGTLTTTPRPLSFSVTSHQREPAYRSLSRKIVDQTTHVTQEQTTMQLVFAAPLNYNMHLRQQIEPDTNSHSSQSDPNAGRFSKPTAWVCLHPWEQYAKMFGTCHLQQGTTSRMFTVPCHDLIGENLSHPIPPLNNFIQTRNSFSSFNYDVNKVGVERWSPISWIGPPLVFGIEWRLGLGTGFGFAKDQPLYKGGSPRLATSDNRGEWSDLDACPAERVFDDSSDEVEEWIPTRQEFLQRCVGTVKPRRRCAPEVVKELCQ